MTTKIAIVGGGLSGLCAGLFLAKQGLGDKVVIIEKEEGCGGLLSSFKYGESVGCFDKGMHHFSETGVKEIDQQLYDILNLSNWRELSGTERNLAGNYFNGKINIKTQYCNTKELENANELLVDFIFNYEKKDRETTHVDLVHLLRRKFGNLITNTIIKPILERKFYSPISELDKMSISLCPFDRVGLFEEELCIELLDTQFATSIAFQDQRNLPISKHSPLKSYYPKRFGLTHAIQQMTNMLQENGVTIITNQSVKELAITDKRIKSIVLDNGKNINVDTLMWSIGLPSLSKLMQISMSDIPFDKPLKTVLVNLLVSNVNNMEDLHSIFCYDDLGINIYRVTNYANYCEDAKRNGLYPLTVELFFDELGSLNKDTIAELTTNALIKMGVLVHKKEVKFIETEYLSTGFPKPTIKNMAGMNELRSRIESHQLENLLLSGILSQENVFFMTDIIKRTYSLCKDAVTYPQ